MITEEMIYENVRKESGWDNARCQECMVGNFIYDFDFEKRGELNHRASFECDHCGKKMIVK